MSEEYDLLQKLYDTGDLIKLRTNSLGSTSFDVPTLHFMVKDTNIYLDVYPGIKNLNRSNHQWFKKIKVNRMFQKGFYRENVPIEKENIIHELKESHKHDLAKLILFNLDLYSG